MGFNQIFGRLIVVTNQQGIGLKIMNEEQLADVHRFMIETIEGAGGRIDKIYHCPDLSKQHPNCRKPNPAMALRAKNNFPEIDFSKSIMVGDSMSDMEFGKRLGMYTVLIEGKEGEILNESLIDLRFDSLFDFSIFLTQL